MTQEKIMTQIMDLATNDFQTVNNNMSKNIKEKTNIINGQGILQEKWK